MLKIAVLLPPVLRSSTGTQGPRGPQAEPIRSRRLLPPGLVLTDRGSFPAAPPVGFDGCDVLLGSRGLSAELNFAVGGLMM